jgi:1-acyl-sn-glycerol-3-phosphate acyltransferase
MEESKVETGSGAEAQKGQSEETLAEMLRRLASVGPVEFIARYIEEGVENADLHGDADFLKWILPLMELFARYFDAEVRGFERVPKEGPLLLVGNHSGGLFVPDTPALIEAWYRERGLDSRLVGLALDAMFAVPGVAQLMSRLGEIPANHANASRALEEGAAVLVYPGGAHEAFRPWVDRNRIDFAGHKGFVRLALRTGVPVVPVVGHGAHESTVVLARGDNLMKRLGLSRLRLGAAPILWQLPWGVSIPFVPGIPLPAKITVELCEPLDWSRYGPEGAEQPEVVDRCYEEITGVMQETLTRLALERPYPLLDRLRSLVPGLSPE